MASSDVTTTLRRRLSLPSRSFVCLPLFVPWLALLGWFSNVAWFLSDDAFISFRYTRNLLEGHGLVFNPGEYVEGYTNFLWILELAAIWGIFGIRPEHAAPWLSVAYTVATIAVMLWWVVRLPSLRNRWLVGWMALGLLCSSATFAVWTSGGGVGNAAVHLFCRHGGGLPEREPKLALGSAGRVAEPGRGRSDAPGGADAGGLLLRLVRRPAHGQGGTGKHQPGPGS